MAASAALLAWACTEQPLTGPGPEEGEDEAAETVELTIAPSEMAAWRDTTVDGFAVPFGAGFLVVADADGRLSRILLRYDDVPSTVVLDSDTLQIEEFRNGSVRLVVDTATSTVSGGDATVRLLTLDRRFDAREATWQQAAEGEPWSDPGGDFDQEIGRATLSAPGDGTLADTLSIPFSTSDSLLKAWRDANGHPGVAALVEAPGRARLTIGAALLEFDAKPAGRDTTVTFRQGLFLGAVPSTFIFDPPNPPPGELLRVGGMPASRFYVSFRPPTEVEGARLPGSTINRAELVFRPAPAPSAPFALDRPVRAAGVRLLADPFRFGVRTPIGDTLADGTLTLEPDSLNAGRAVRLDLTDVLTRWASNPDSAGSLGVGVRLRPDAQSLGFWEFGSVASPAALRPILRVVLTPPSDFEVP